MTVYLALQPILSASRATFGQELLYRSGESNSYDARDRHTASLELLNNGPFLHGLPGLLGNGQLFINFEPETLVKGYAHVLPASSTVLELQADTEVDSELLRSAQTMQGKGYRIACDNVRPEHLSSPLLSASNIAKVNVQSVPRGEWSSLVKSCQEIDVCPIAERVETEEDFQAARVAGFRYFQGYFFSRPKIMQGEDLPSSKSSQLMLLKEINRPEVDFGTLEKVLASDVGLAYKLLTLINSAAFGLRQHVDSLRQAAMFLGETGVRKWASVIIFRQIGTGAPSALLLQSMVRAGFCEAFALRAGYEQRQHEYYLLGLFSLLDAVLKRPMEQIASHLPLAEDIRRALLDDQTEPRKILDMAIAHEQANWTMVERTLASFQVQESEIAPLYWRSVAQAQSILA